MLKRKIIKNKKVIESIINTGFYRDCKIEIDKFFVTVNERITEKHKKNTDFLTPEPSQSFEISTENFEQLQSGSVLTIKIDIWFKSMNCHSKF